MMEKGSNRRFIKSPCKIKSLCGVIISQSQSLPIIMCMMPFGDAVSIIINV